ncbi:MAG: hypothetical protein ACI4VW_02600 [Acutalibacteraceae bacterium]
MNKTRGKIFLSIIIAVQLLVPLIMVILTQYQENQLEQKGEEIKLVVDYVEFFYDDFENPKPTIRVGSNEFDSSMNYYDDPGYVFFEKGEDGYAFCVATANKPETDIYLRQNDYYWDQLVYDYEYEVADADYIPWDLYSKENEKSNIVNGRCEGPQTEAYAILKVYKNRCKVVDVYIDGLKVEEVLEKYENGEIDLSRYDYNFFDDYDEYDSEDYYDDTEEYYDEDVTQPVKA